MRRSVSSGRAGLRIAAIAIVLALGGCNDWELQAPPRTRANQPIVDIPDSTVVVPVQIRTAVIAGAVMDAFRNNPLSEGRSPEISAKLLVEERKTVDKLVDVLISPAKPAECIIKQVPKQIVSRVKVGIETFRCALSPWRWGKCSREVFRDVVETITEPVQVCSPAVLEAWQKQMQPVLELHEAVFPTSIWLIHDLHLNGLTIGARGNRLTVIGDLKLDVGIDLRQGVLGASMTVKGALKCDSELTLRLEADVHVTPAATIDISVADVALDWRKACVPGAVEAFDAASILNPTFLLASKGLGGILENQLRKELNRAIQQGAADDLNFRDDLVRATPLIRQPHPIGELIWLEVNPTRIVISDIRGVGEGASNAIIVDAGFVGRPRITAGPRPQTDANGELPFVIGAGPPGLSLAIEGAVPLAAAQERVATLLRQVVDDRFSQQPYTTGSVELYQSSDRIVVGVDIQTRSSGAKLGTVYVWARPQLSDDRRTLQFSEVGFDVASRNVLAKAAAWLLDGTIEKKLEEASIPFGGALDRVQQQNRVFAADINIGLLRGSLESIDAGAVWIGEGAVRVLTTARGQAHIDLKAPKLN